ncbi:MAG: alkaline phosphatase family protein [Abyssibacter sp.]|uniref:alkaline phosphatase family protein n=1 Tax=Abyssibacter sp. TaxID=2320200 RepID=UPI00321C15EB
MPNTQQLLIIGVDAGSPELFQQWMDTGDMPNLAALRARSLWGGVQSPYALEAGAVWPVFHSGRLPGRQPQYDGRRYFGRHDYQDHWYELEETPPPVWRQLSDQGIDCLLIDPPYLRLDPALRGTMVVDWGGHVPANGRRFELSTVPEEVAEDILAAVGPDPTGGVSCDRQAPESIEDLRAFIQRYQTRLRQKAKLTVHLMQTRQWDLAMSVFTDLHCTGHHVWHINDRSHPQYDPKVEAELGEPLRDCYRLFDEALGQILDACGDQTNIMLFGSHGMGPQYSGTGLLDRVLLTLDQGRPAARSRSWKASARALWQTLPVEWRARMKHLRKPFEGKLHPPRFLGNHAQRRFFEVYANNASGGVRINLKGREAQGLVDPADYPALVAQLQLQLRELVNVDTGEPLVDDVIVTRDHYDGAYLDALPDLLVVWNRNHPIRAVHSEATGTIVQETVDGRTGDHTPNGIYLVSGPAVAGTGEGAVVKAEDFAPSLAEFFGCQLAETDGQSRSLLQHGGAF